MNALLRILGTFAIIPVLTLNSLSGESFDLQIEKNQNSPITYLQLGPVISMRAKEMSLLRLVQTGNKKSGIEETLLLLSKVHENGIVEVDTRDVKRGNYRAYLVFTDFLLGDSVLPLLPLGKGKTGLTGSLVSTVKIQVHIEHRYKGSTVALIIAGKTTPAYRCAIILQEKEFGYEGDWDLGIPEQEYSFLLRTLNGQPKFECAAKFPIEAAAAGSFKINGLKPVDVKGPVARPKIDK